MTEKHESFVGYEYKDITIKGSMASIYTDSYANFGWELEKSSIPPRGSSYITLKLKRNRQLRNKAEISHRQRQFEQAMETVRSLEQAKIFKAALVAYIVGVIGTAFMAGSVFALTAGSTTLCLLLAIPGLIGWVAPYWLYRGINRQKTAELNPMIDEQYDDIYELCDQANQLLQA